MGSRLLNGRLSNNFLILLEGLLILLLLQAKGYSLELVFERRATRAIETSWFVYPVYAKLHSIGEARGVGGTLSGLRGSEMDITGVHVEGEGISKEPFSLNVFAILDIPLLPFLTKVLYFKLKARLYLKCQILLGVASKISFISKIIPIV